VQTPNPPFHLRTRISSVCSSCCHQQPSQRACPHDRSQPHLRALLIRSTHAKKLAQYRIHVDTGAPLPAGLVAHAESVIKKPRADEEESNFAIKTPREAEAAAVVLLVADWPIITSRAVCICAYILVFENAVKPLYIVFGPHIENSLLGLLPPRSYSNKLSFSAILSILCTSIVPIEPFSHLRRNLYGNCWRFAGSTASSCIQLFNSFSSSSRVRLCPL
jgi:hypothetical protein